MANRRARNLRANQTDAEKKLWSRLREKQLGGHKFRRQHPLDNYIVDFICLEKRLIIEADGGQHADQIEADVQRTAYLEACGHKVIRFWNNDILQNIDGVCEQILLELNNR